MTDKRMLIKSIFLTETLFEDYQYGTDLLSLSIPTISIRVSLTALLKRTALSMIWTMGMWTAL